MLSSCATRLLIEFDGIQHFEFVSHFTRDVDSMLSRRFADIRKNHAAIVAPYPTILLRIAHTDLPNIEKLILTAIDRAPAINGKNLLLFSNAEMYANQIHWHLSCPQLAQAAAVLTLQRWWTHLLPLRIHSEQRSGRSLD